MYVLASESAIAESETVGIEDSTDALNISNANPAVITFHASALPDGYNVDDITGALTTPTTVAADTIAISGITGSLAATYNITYTVASATQSGSTITVTTTSDLSGAASAASPSNTAADTSPATGRWTNNYPTMSTQVYPADRCTWHVVPESERANDANRRIESALFHPGNAAATTVANPRFGYIGKTGRFVEIAS